MTHPSMSGRALARVAALLGLCCAMTTAAGDARADDPPPMWDPGHADDSSGQRERSWQLRAVTPDGQPPAALEEEQLIGGYEQPRWTATRRFTTTRAYVVPEGKVEAELWGRATIDGDVTKYRFLQELEFGLPHRFQFDFYFRQDLARPSDDDAQVAAQFEVRWALAKWGRIFANPALYLEYILKDGSPDVLEPKLLFSGGISERWHGALNLTLEQELSGQHEREWGVTGGISYTVIDMCLGLGVESVVHAVDVAGSRGDFDWEWFIGPSIQWKPVKRFTINVVPMIGPLKDAARAQIYLNLGVEI
ncbi:MAG: hypothetical protein H6744_19785 [Deltaproteobacteria bacterium]|nr:hypothetical protein [Deltaproteobacteria bacterium]MCB9788924.1 hypothetical protein [Deltaproteobacteria bacterium]